MSTLEEVDGHYRSHLGEGVEYFSFSPPHEQLAGVLEWPLEASRYKTHFYATLGLHQLAKRGTKATHRFEIFTGVDNGTDDIRLSFALMANYIISEKIYLRSGSLLSLPQGMMFDGYSFSSWLMLERYDDLIPQISLSNGDHVTFLNSIPVFPEEVRYLENNGLDSLFDLWAADNVRTSDLNRSVPSGLMRL